MENNNEGYIKESKLVDVACEYLYTILRGFGIEDVDVSEETAEDGVILNIRGGDIGAVIGKHGSVLDAIQYLTNLVVNQNSSNYFRVKINACEYREKREKALELLGKKIATKVKKTGRIYSLEPMSAYDRRLIHLAIKDFIGVKSVSEGNGVNRHIVIMSTRDFSQNSEFAMNNSC
ncbi:MAG: KH domain-containing protein [Oscillospiraceae bacterium]|jgi:spoIIIJ-associated protein|nr:KH domain-containing protein [Oscillospiraceae bacterium]